MNKKRRNEKGFTMVELVIVIAIMGIIGAVLVPSFNTMSAKAKISTDIATVKTLKRTADIYKAEMGTWPTQLETNELIEELRAKNYLEGTIKLQSEKLGAKIENKVDEQTIKLDLKDVKDSNTIKALKQIDDVTKKDWIVKPTVITNAEDWPADEVKGN